MSEEDLTLEERVTAMYHAVLALTKTLEHFNRALRALADK